MLNTQTHVIVVGAGLAGLAAAITAADNGCRVTILEKADKIGGAAAYSGGLVWVPANHAMQNKGLKDTPTAARDYLLATGKAHSQLLEEPAMDRWIAASAEAAKYFEDLGAVSWEVVPTMPDYHYPDAPGSTPEGRFLSATFDGSNVGKWREKLRVSPHFPVGTTYDELFSPDLASQLSVASQEENEDHSSSTSTGYFSATTSRVEGSDLLTMGTGVVAGFLAYASSSDAIEILIEHHVTALQFGGDSVTGVVIDTPEGEKSLLGEVVLTTSGYDWDAELTEKYAELGTNDAGSVAPQSLSGDGIRLVEQVGGAVKKFPGQCLPVVPGHSINEGKEFRYAHEYAYPHSFIVNELGKRFADDSYYTDICWNALEPGNRHLPMYLIWDSEHRQRYGGAGAQPGEAYPDLVKSGSTMQELAAELDIDGEQLERTAQEFNKSAVKGNDPIFGRGTKAAVRKFSGDPSHELHPNVAPVAKGPFYGMRIRLISAGIGMSGIHVDPEGRVLDQNGTPVPGLYAAGAATAFTASGSGYQSGYSLSRAITLGYTIGQLVNRSAEEHAELRPSIN